MLRSISVLFALLLAFVALRPSNAQSPDLIDRGQDATELIVLFHAFDHDAASFDPLRDLLRKDADRFKHSDIVQLESPFGVFSMTDPADAVADALSRIDALWSAKAETGQPYSRILLVGHSMGALYARKVYVAASGERPAAPFEPELTASLKARNAATLEKPRPWAEKIDRIVLLAGMNRGWTISHHTNLTRAALMTVGTWFGNVTSLFGATPIIFSARRGAPFITQLRLQWLDMRTQALATRNQPEGSAGTRCPEAPPLGGACVIQLLGTVDDLVPPEDNIDLLTGDDFIYLDVPRSGHANVIKVDDPDYGRQRADIILAAIKERDFSKNAIRPAGNILKPDHTVTDVVFVMHGIRDEGFWTEKISRRIVKFAKDTSKGVIATETSSYGYFPMLSFLQPGARQEKVEWFMDRYTAAKAQYPEARFSYVGHSNGTYLLAKALQDYPAVKFKNVAFAGSVVNKNFDWSELIQQRRVDHVLNFLASADWVVAWFPNALQEMGLQDLGSAGHDGFQRIKDVNTRYVVGGHGAALDEDWWNAIAQFVVTGTYTEPKDARAVNESIWWVRYPAYIAWAIWVLIAVVAALLLRKILRLDIREWQKTLAVVGYFYVIWTILTQV